MNEQPSEFCQEKIRILKDYVEKGEEIISNIEDWESLAAILEARDELIVKLQKLELKICENGSGNGCSLEQKNQIDNLVKLILDHGVETRSQQLSEMLSLISILN